MSIMKEACISMNDANPLFSHLCILQDIQCSLPKINQSNINSISHQNYI